MTYILSVRLFFTAILLTLSSLCYARLCEYQKGRTFFNKNTCKELEHCQNDQFDNITGQCGIGGQCKPGWMGPNCQYFNLAYSSGNQNHLFDGNWGTGENVLNISVQLRHTFIVSAINIIGNFSSGLTVSINGSNGRRCYFGLFPENTWTIFCHRVLKTSVLSITLGFRNDVKEVEVFGGQNVALWKRTNQSSNYETARYESDKAVDGWDGRHDFNSESCTHTSGGEVPTWTVALGDYYSVMSILIANRDDQNRKRIDGFSITGKTRSGTNIPIYRDVNPPTAGRRDIWIDSENIPLEPVNEIIIKGNERSSNKILTLCEVYIFACIPSESGQRKCLQYCPKNCESSQVCLNDNFSCSKCLPGWSGLFCDQESSHLPLEKYCDYQLNRKANNIDGCTALQHCSSVSTFDQRTGACIGHQNQCEKGWTGPGCQYVNLAINLGNKDAMFDGNRNSGRDIPVASVVLKGTFTVTAVNIYVNPMQSCTNIVIKDHSNHTCYSGKIPMGNPTIFFSRLCNTSVLTIEFGRMMFVKEIEVFGGKNVALWKTTNQSTNLSTWTSDKAVDGSAGDFSTNTCSHTNQNINSQPTWKVFLGNSYAITSIRIRNRIGFQERIDGFMVFGVNIEQRVLIYDDGGKNRITDRDDIWIDSSHMPQMRVHEIQIELPYGYNKILTLCEVFVFACSPTENGKDNCLSYCPQHCSTAETCLNENFSCRSCEKGWTGLRCSQGSCAKPSISSQMNISPDQNKYPYNTTINITCKEGYTLQGSSMAVCGSNASFTFEHHPICNGIQCTKPIISSQMNISPDQNKYSYNTAINITCKEGYTLQGSSMAVCGSNASFTFEHHPICIATTCSLPTLPQNSHLAFHFTGRQNTNSVFQYNEEIQLLCVRGFNISHSVKGKCGSNGKFYLPPLPTCKRIVCHLPDISQNDSLLINETRPNIFYDETISFTCGTGFNIMGTSVFRCGLNGRFNIHDALPSCSRIQCSLPDFSMKSNLIVNETRQVLFYGETIRFMCEEGYNINGTTVSACELNGHFNIHDPPVCKKVQCIVQEVSHLNVFPESSTYSFNDVISFSCEEGFYISNNITATCDHGNKWRIPNWPGCKRIKCSLPTDFQNRSIILSPNLTEYDYNTVIKISCLKGYRLKGESHKTCQFYGDLQLPTCEVESESISSSYDAVIAGSVVGALLLISIPFLVIVVIIWRRRSRKPDFTRKSNETHSLNNLNQLNPKDTSGIQRKNAPKPKPYTVEETSTYYNLNSTDLDKAKKARQDVYYEFSPTLTPSATSVKVSEFKDYVENKRRHKEYFNEEFKKFFTGLQFPATAATTPGNRAKNKYKNIYPYDDTRVKLKTDKGHSKSDFINASTIHGYGSVKSYIAAQGPLVDTIGDFWWMVWNEGCEKIVMLTNLIEDERVKCIQYWPDKNTMSAGNLKIEVVDVENFADFTIRTFLLKKSEEERMIRQFHFTSWPDKGVPLYASSLVHFHSKVKSTTSQGKGPLVVHCSAGIGRTGTFIALDYLIQQAKESEYVDVFGCVETLRRQRVNMVQTVEQYIFVHSALLEALMCTSSDPSTTEFPQLFNDLMNIDYNTGKRNIDIHFENVLSSLGEIPESAFRFAKDPENKKKNRYSNVLPVDNEMPELRDAENKRVYINAIFLPAYKTRRSFIVTQMPLKDTVDDFWKLLSDQKVSTIVMLNQTEPTKLNNEKNIGIYWPEGSESKQYGVVIVSKESSSSNEKDYTIIDLLFKIKDSEDVNEEERRIRIFKCNFWPDSRTIPASILSFLKLVNAVELHHDRNNTGPVVVHCMNGAEKSGLFCVLQVVLERMKIEQDVAIHSVIQQMRSVRPSIIPNVEQFKFCYDVVMEFMKQYDAYSNFQ